ncbi:thermonuclease family protein [Haloarchaeobius baliensis]|uniref:thermonuclease family protein n=1 Tax=Haloarchaeobius baliensis TaxID=1670458 RepID=UPI003F883873
MATLAATSLGSVVSATGAGASSGQTAALDVGQLRFYSTGSLLNAASEPLTDSSNVLVWAEPTAYNADEDGNGDAVSYPDGTDIPLVGIDGTVVGIGNDFVNNQESFGDAGNEEFLLNVWDSLTGGDATVLVDESHDNAVTRADISTFANYAEDNGYTVPATTDLEADLGSADGLVLARPATALSDDELSAVASFVDAGGALFLHDASDYQDQDQTANLNAVAAAVGAAFRFNDDQVYDDENSGFENFVVLTENGNTEQYPELFAGREGIGGGELPFEPGESYPGTVTSVADGDTFTVEFDDPDAGSQSIRVLGVDTAEKPENASAERPEEWEGLAYTTESDLRPVGSLSHYSGTCFLDDAMEPLTDDAAVLYWAPSNATVTDQNGGDAVSYPDGTAIPLGVKDDNLVGLGANMVNDEGGWDGDNGDLVLNVWDDQLGGAGTVVWLDNGQYDTLGDVFGNFEGRAEDAGYTLESAGDLAAAAGDADAFVVSSPNELSDANRDALATFAADGNPVTFIGKSDYDGFDQTDALNAVLDELGAAFRYNDAQVQADGNFAFSTEQFNTDSYAAYFGGDSEDPLAHLQEWAVEATEFATQALSGEDVVVSFDENEGITDPFDRLLGYVEYDATGDGSTDTLYNAALIQEGYARVYGSSLSKHDEFWDHEHAARTDGTGLWAESDVESAPSYRNRPVEDLFVPTPAAVGSTNGTLGQGRVPVNAESSASVSEAPLAGVDRTANVAMLGGLLVDESHEEAEGSGYDVSGFENFTFVSNLADSLSGREGDVLVDGGHGQFGADFGLSNEDAAYYQRFLEGAGLNFEQVNEPTAEKLSRGRALLVTSHTEAFSEAEVDALRSFRDDGGAIVLLGDANASDAARENLNALASGLGTDLRLTDDAVTDGSNNVNGDAGLVTTTNFHQSFDLFDVYEPGTGGEEPAQPTLSVSFPERNGGGSAVPADLSLSNAPDGLAGFDVTITVADTEVAAAIDVSFDDAFPDSTTQADVSDDGGTVSLEAADIEDNVGTGASDITLATLSLEPQSAGSTGVGLGIDALDADDGSVIDAQTSTGDLTIAPVERIGDNDLPTDPDDDGVYEDLNGNGQLDFEDVVVFFEHREEDAIQDYVDSYDFNDNGRVDFDDITTLFEEI